MNFGRDRLSMEPFKNQFSLAAAGRIADAMGRFHPSFNRRAFLRGLGAELEPLELKARMLCLADRLEGQLPQDLDTLLPILVGALAADEVDEMGLRGFLVWPLTEIVARRGAGDFDKAMWALTEMTRRFTAEFAIRPFLLEAPKRTLEQLMIWTADPDEHVRRLASEGSRPLLPWGGKLTAFLENPNLTRPILDALRNDTSEYVRRSVANHLNDFSRSCPEHVITTLRSWKKSGAPADPQTTARAARTLIKEGHPEALALLGFATDVSLVLVEFTLRPERVAVGGVLECVLRVRNEEAREINMLLDYAVHFQGADGGLRRKVFKGRRGCLAPGEERTFTLRHSFRPVTTRTYYPGEHRIEPLLNGVTQSERCFLLEC
jgi:3-methyladenine DNA glycosylase AlkC